MAVRPVDAEKYMELLKEQYLHHEAMGNKQVAKAWQGAMQLLYDMPTLTPPNEPLTLDELRGMDGQPVWVKCLKPDKYTYPPVEWRILEMSFTGNFGVWNGDCALIERNYGTDWIAYRRPPEGEEDT